MKKIAVANENGKVAGHFGQCEAFSIYEIEEGAIVNSQVIDSPEHKHGYMPTFLEENGVDIVIVGGLGQGAVNKLSEKNIEIIRGAEGDIDKVIKSYLEGTLETRDEVCIGHGHEEGHHHGHHHGHGHCGCH